MKRLITSALPYVNNIPHLGNLLQVLSGDVFARFCRLKGYETLYIGGNDEYGTATETRALEEGKSPRELCDYYHKIHTEIYKWFNISFDKFGRTSTPQQTEITQSIFKDLDSRGFIKEETSEQVYCNNCGRFLADRFVKGICPACGYEGARGDQCENCGKLLDPLDLKSPVCSTCGHTPEVKPTKHLYIDLPGILPEYEKWMKKASVEGRWAKNALQMTQAWIRDGLHERAITRDLKWGIPVPKEGYEDKVFYVWFDAPIGYISITKCLGDEKGFDWKDWWLNPKNVELFQFIGKDNIPFHTVIFPCSLIGSGKNWTKLFHMSSTEYLNYEGGKFSKSQGIGVFGSDAMESGIPADIWRFYMFYNRPEKADTLFTWKDFQEKINGELVGNLCNLVNRTLTFVIRYFDGKIPVCDRIPELWTSVLEKEKNITESMEWAELKDALHEIFAISSIANKAFQDGEPWKTRTENPQSAERLISNLCYVIKDLMIMAEPFIPDYSLKVLSFFGKTENYTFNWDCLGKTEGLNSVLNNEIIFRPMDDKTAAAFREKFSGSQKERNKGGTGNAGKPVIDKKNEKKSPDRKEHPLSGEDMENIFNSKIDLRTAKIVKIERHPDAEKLYIETLDDGSGTERVIISGLVPYLNEEDLLGKSIVIAYNLAPRKMRGVMSNGMLLAGDYKNAEGKDCVEVLDSSWAEPGTQVTLEGFETSGKESMIDADTFFSVPIVIKDGFVTVNGKKLLIDGKPIKMKYVVNGEVS